MSYPAINFPISTPIRETTKKEAQLYYEWFLSIIEERIKILTEFVRKEVDNNWVADFSKESLPAIGAWLSKHAKNRKVSLDERKREVEQNKLSGVQAELTMEVEEVLSDDTVLRCFDVGIYVGETLRKNSNWGLHWLYNTAPKGLVTLHEPVLALGKNKLDLSPRLAMQGFASKLIRGMVTESHIIRLYDLWSEMFTPNYKPPHFSV